VLGILCMIDEGEADWKVVAIDREDPWSLLSLSLSLSLSVCVCARAGACACEKCSVRSRKPETKSSVRSRKPETKSSVRSRKPETLNQGGQAKGH
jgi:hypothetical protein